MDDSKSQREQRLAAALRANLQRRKQAGQGGNRNRSDEAQDTASETSDADRPAGKP